MLRLVVVTAEEFDEETQRFVEASSVVLELEHSLLSVSKWESRWKIPFLDSRHKTDEQVQSYVHMMNSSGEIPPEVWIHLTTKHFEVINGYINDPMTATTIHEQKQQKNNEIITAELIYYWMIALGVPFECENWHLNRLLTLIKVCNIKNTPKDKQTGGLNKASAADRRALNEQRRREMGSSG